MKDFRKLQVWEKSHLLVCEIYRVTKVFPREEQYGLTSQMRRCAASVPTNIAEGCGRNGDAELARFLDIAMGSASELEYLVLLSRDVAVLNVPDFERITSQVTEVKRMLGTLIMKLRK